MRSTRRDLEAVVAKFAGWREKRQGRTIPDELWDAAIKLLDGHKATEICLALGLNPTRFKQMREARLGRRVARRRPVAVAAPVGNGFFELARPRIGLLGEKAPTAPAYVGTGCRLTLETAAGTLHVVSAAPGSALVETVCRLVVGALGDGPRA